MGGDKFFENNLLANPDPLIRQWTAVALGRIANPRALPLLYKALRSGDADIKAAAAFAIGEIEDRDLREAQFRDFDPEATTELRRLLNDTSLAVQMRATEALGKIGSHAEAVEIAQRLERFSYDGEATGRTYLEYAITALARLKDPVASRVLEQLVSCPDPQIQWRALDALARLGTTTAGPPFIKSLGNANAEVRAYAARGIGSVGDPSLAVRLLPMLPPQDLQTGKRNPLPVRVGALQALGELKNASAMPAIRAALEAEPIDDAHPDQYNFAIEAAIAIGSIGDAEGESALLPLLKSGLPVRNTAVIALAKILKGNPQRFFQVVDRFEFFDSKRETVWAQALGELGGEEAGKELKEMLGRALDRSASTRNRTLPSILAALAKSQAPGWQDALARFFGSQDPAILRAVVDAYQPKADAKAPWAPIVQAFNACAPSGNKETRIEILARLKPWIREAEVQGMLRSNLKDADQDVRIVCARMLRSAGATDISDDPGPAKSSISDALAYAIADIRLRSTIAIVETDRGNIEIELFRQDAPLTTESFVLEAQRGMYNGLEFTKVFAGRQIEGETQTSQTPFRRAIKSEAGMLPFEQGRLGMALTGRDSNPNRLFITLSPQPYLDGTYTCFGRVLSGLQVVETFVPGDRINRISIKETISFLNYYKY